MHNPVGPSLPPPMKNTGLRDGSAAGRGEVTRAGPGWTGWGRPGRAVEGWRNSSRHREAVLRGGSGGHLVAMLSTEA